MIGIPLRRQTTIDRYPSTGVELDHDIGLDRQCCVDIQSETAVYNVWHVGFPCRVRADRTADSDAIDLVASRGVFAEDHLRTINGESRVTAIAREHTVQYLGCRGSAKPKAVVEVILKRVSLEKRRRGVDQLCSIATAPLKRAVHDARRGTVQREIGIRGARAIVVTRAAITDNHMIQNGDRIVRSISKIECAPITCVRFRCGPVVLCIAAVSIIFK